MRHMLRLVMAAGLVMAGAAACRPALAQDTGVVGEEKDSRPAPKKPAPRPQAAKPAEEATAAEIAFWNSVKDSKSVDEIRTYLKTYPKGTFAELARVKIKGLEGGGTSAVAGAGEAAARLSEADIRDIQGRLYNLNFQIAKTDGQLDVATVDAIRGWQKAMGLPATGDMTATQLQRLRSQKPPGIWGAIGYSGQGTLAPVWNLASRQDAEAKALAGCKSRTAVECKVVTVAATQCAAIARFVERSADGSGNITGLVAARQSSLSNAQLLALLACNKDPRSLGRCEIHAKVCANGTHVSGAKAPSGGGVPGAGGQPSAPGAVPAPAPARPPAKPKGQTDA
jgi:peptidoglycan hydrolase-like protein with peptidoglycan-binding domain